MNTGEPISLPFLYEASDEIEQPYKHFIYYDGNCLPSKFVCKSELLSKIKPSDFVVLLDLGKEQPDSVELSSRLEKWMRDGGSSITFVIGGSLGLSNEMRKRGNASLTLSKLTFTHQMTRVILLEQIYRSFKILRNEPYHK